MAGMVGRWRQIGRWTLTACSAVVCIWALQGCATNTSPGVSDVDAGLVTPSDEPESRRRARIRLELASNYFELGRQRWLWMRSSSLCPQTLLMQMLSICVV